MIRIEDIGGAPAGVPCAQLGTTSNFLCHNLLEVETYKAALVARHGAPPDGGSLIVRANTHDFGVYYTLQVRDDGRSAASTTWFDECSRGLDSWIEAGFRSPVEYDRDYQAQSTAGDVNAVIRSALSITRPSPSGGFPINDFVTLHANLSAAYPVIAAQLKTALTA